MRRPRPLVIAALVLLFAVPYPYLDAAGFCGEAGCPHFAQGHQAPAEIPTGALAVALAAAATPVLIRSFGPRHLSDRRPAQFYAAPDPEPPRP